MTKNLELLRTENEDLLIEVFNLLLEGINNLENEIVIERFRRKYPKIVNKPIPGYEIDLEKLKLTMWVFAVIQQLFESYLLCVETLKAEYFFEDVVFFEGIRQKFCNLCDLYCDRFSMLDIPTVRQVTQDMGNNRYPYFIVMFQDKITLYDSLKTKLEDALSRLPKKRLVGGAYADTVRRLNGVEGEKVVVYTPQLNAVLYTLHDMEKEFYGILGSVITTIWYYNAAYEELGLTKLVKLIRRIRLPVNVSGALLVNPDPDSKRITRTFPEISSLYGRYGMFDD